METFLRCFVNACPSKWSDWIHLAEFWYNASDHSAIGCSPFMALYGYEPRHFGISPASAISTPDLATWLRDREAITALIKQHLTRSRLRMKIQADKKRSERSFEVGDLIFLKLQPYAQSSLATRANQKLSYKFFGPYRVLARVGQVAYKLDLPESSSIHPVFHVSQLKLAVPSTVQVTPNVPDDIELPRVPEKVLQRRMYTRGLRPRRQVLIKWSRWPESLATWEDLDNLQRAFPFAPAWGQAAAQRGRNVTKLEGHQGTSSGLRRSSRPKRPCTRTNSHIWVQ